ncbi:MAG: molybdopterin-containing oxidoreductase family protein, partial [Caldilineaceae bacterium]
NMNRLGDVLSLDPAVRARALYHPRPVDPIPTAADAGAPVHALIVYNCNPVAVTPDQGAVMAGLKRDDLFTIVLEQFHTDTADYADLVLPATTQLEHWDLLKPYGHLHLALNRPAIAPLGEALPNSEIFRRLAAALGYDDPCFAESDEQMLRNLVAAQSHPRFAGITWERLMAEGYVRLNLPSPWLPFAEGGFPTPSGKCEFFSAQLAADGYDPLPTYTPPAWQTAADRAPEEAVDTLVVISPPAHSFLNSTFVNIERFRAREGAPLLQMHPQDAAARNLAAGDLARISNARGEVLLPVVLTEGLAPGTVLAPGVWWARFAADGRTINQVVSQDEADMGAGAIFYDTVVHVERAKAAALSERPPTAAAVIMA